MTLILHLPRPYTVEKPHIFVQIDMCLRTFHTRNLSFTTIIPFFPDGADF